MTAQLDLFGRSPAFAQIDVGDLQIDGTVSGWDLALAGATLVLTWLIGRAVRRGVLQLLQRVSGVSEDLRRLTARIARYFVWAIGLGVALAFLGAQTQPVLSGVVIVGVIAALALRGIAENFGAGLVIQTRQAISIGDHIESQGHIGTVIEVNGRAVVIETDDGRRVHLPNAEVLGNPIANETVNGRRRSEIEVRTSGSAADLDRIAALIDEAASSAESVDSAVPVAVLTTAVEPDRVTFLVRVWHRPGSSGAARSDVVGAVAVALRDAGIDATVVAPPPPPPITPAPDR